MVVSYSFIDQVIDTHLQKDEKENYACSLQELKTLFKDHLFLAFRLHFQMSDFDLRLSLLSKKFYQRSGLYNIGRQSLKNLRRNSLLMVDPGTLEKYNTEKDFQIAIHSWLNSFFYRLEELEDYIIDEEGRFSAIVSYNGVKYKIRSTENYIEITNQMPPAPIKRRSFFFRLLDALFFSNLTGSKARKPDAGSFSLPIIP